MLDGVTSEGGSGGQLFQFLFSTATAEGWCFLLNFVCLLNAGRSDTPRFSLLSLNCTSQDLKNLVFYKLIPLFVSPSSKLVCVFHRETSIGSKNKTKRRQENQAPHKSQKCPLVVSAVVNIVQEKVRFMVSQTDRGWTCLICKMRLGFTCLSFFFPLHVLGYFVIPDVVISPVLSTLVWPTYCEQQKTGFFSACTTRNLNSTCSNCLMYKVKEKGNPPNLQTEEKLEDKIKRNRRVRKNPESCSTGSVCALSRCCERHRLTSWCWKAGLTRNWKVRVQLIRSQGVISHSFLRGLYEIYSPLQERGTSQ